MMTKQQHVLEKNKIGALHPANMVIPQLSLLYVHLKVFEHLPSMVILIPKFYKQHLFLNFINTLLVYHKTHIKRTTADEIFK